MSKITMIGIDTAKQVFHLVGIDQHGKYELRQKRSRSKLLSTLAQREPCTVVMEACAASHHWARQIAALGHRVRLIAPQPLVRVTSPLSDVSRESRPLR